MEERKEEIKEKILQKRTFQKKAVGLVLSVLGRGLKVCSKTDEPVMEELKDFPMDFVFVMGVWGSKHPMMLQNRADGLHHLHESFAAVCQKLSAPQTLTNRFSAQNMQPQKMLEIRFKSVEAGWRMVTGQLSAAQAYARHDLLIIGEISQSMAFLRCIERAEAYLLPQFLLKRILPAYYVLPQKRWKFWKQMLHLKSKQEQ